MDQPREGKEAEGAQGALQDNPLACRGGRRNEEGTPGRFRLGCLRKEVWALAKKMDGEGRSGA